jgi:hypothetical protein
VADEPTGEVLQSRLLRVTVRVDIRQSDRVLPVLYSADGKSLFVIDGHYVLHRLDADHLVRTASLDIQARCKHIAFSQAGLLVAVAGANAIWIIDPDTLQVRRQVPLPDVHLVAGSPATNIGFALGDPAAEIGKQGPAILYMIDFATGKLLHTLKSQYTPANATALMVENTRLFDAMQGHIGLLQSPDGKSLYLAGRKICKFRLQGEDLIFEAATANLMNGNTTHIVLSPDGKWIAMPTGGGNRGGGYLIDIYDTANLSKPALTIDNGPYPVAVGFDPKTGNIYSPDHKKINVYSSRGGKLYAADIPDPLLLQIVMHPSGERFVLQARTKLFAYTVGAVPGMPD